jgi:hypothetical protein
MLTTVVAPHSPAIEQKNSFFISRNFIFFHFLYIYICVSSKSKYNADNTYYYYYYFLGSTAQLGPWPPPQNPAEFLGGFSTIFFFTG